MDFTGIMLNEKKPFSEGYMLHDSIYITFLKWQNEFWRKDPWLLEWFCVRVVLVATVICIWLFTHTQSTYKTGEIQTRSVPSLFYYTNLNFLALAIYYAYVRYYHVGQLLWNSLCYSYSFFWVLNYLKCFLSY